MKRKCVAIVQEYLPDYRIGFFGGLIERLDSSGIDILLVAGEGAGSQTFRDRGAVFGDHLLRVSPKVISLAGRQLSYYGSSRHWRACHGVIMQLRGISPDLNLELARKRCSGRRVGVWGHIVPSVKPGNEIDLAIERRQMRSSDHVFAYTRSGARLARSIGVDSSRVTAVMNSVDVSELVTAYESIEFAALRDYREIHGLGDRKTFGYVGRLDAEKRIEFLAATLDRLWDIDKSIKILVGGKGAQEALLKPAEKRGQVALLGFIDTAEMAKVAHVSKAFVNPGHIGLLAVECLAMGLPIITTNHKLQSPEYEYLTVNKDVFLSEDDPESFAQEIAEFQNCDVARRERKPRPYPSLPGMVENFARGIESMMD